MAITKLIDIDPNLPEDDDNIAEGAFRMRELRLALLSQFPGFVQALDQTVTDTWLNQLSRKMQVTGGNLDAKNNRMMNLVDGINSQDAATLSQLKVLEARIAALEAASPSPVSE